MGPTIFAPAARAALRERLYQLTPETPRRWGRMVPAAMVEHLGYQIELALGDREMAPMRSILRLPPFNWLAIYAIPFPRNIKTPDALVPPAEPAALDAARDQLDVLIARVVALGPDALGDSPHPLFGRISGRAWGRLIYRHIEHHLRQFGL